MMGADKKINCFAAGLAIFAMFFGAGNIIFPLALGRFALDGMGWGLAGMLLTAILVPFAGLFAMFRYQGQVRLFFNRLGKIPGLLVACLIIALLGPFGAAPRCIALAHSTLSIATQKIPMIAFSAFACLFIGIFAYREHRLMKWLGYVLSPLKIGFLIAIIVKGMIDTPLVVGTSSHSSLFYFWHGLTEGYYTMDLLAAFFFAPIVISSMGGASDTPAFRRFALKSTAIGALLLALIYGGFCYLASLYAHELQGIPHSQLLGVIAACILGPYAGMFVSITVVVACLTTSLALIAAFVSFVHKEVIREKIGYRYVLQGALLLTFLVSSLEFQGIAGFLNPILQLLYPVLIVLTLYNLIVKRELTDLRS